MRFLPRTYLRRPRQPAAPLSSFATVHVHCGQRAETKVRALCVLALSRPGAHLEALHVDRPDEATVHLRVTAALHSPQTTVLDHLVDQLSREPHVRDLHWHQHHTPGTRAHEPGRRLSRACCPGA
ncbi:hypothetical protein [Streptomyces sp. NBC_00212]|uniref:hypothetical protein n=1 Tax=Streptomyces sp. NBC_00212 TaxID=2975684 RepID=UPI0032466AA2